MYPEYNDPAFGTFIKIMEEQMRNMYPDFEIEVVAIRGRSHSIFDKITKYFKFYSSLLWKTIIKSYDIIYVHTITFPTPPLRIVALFRNLNIIFNVHGSDVLSQSRISFLLKRLCCPLIKKCKFLVVPSEYFKNIVVEELPISPNKILVSPSGGVDNIFFQDKIIKETHLYTIGYVSRINKEKGWLTFIESLYLFDKYNIPFKAVIAGSGEDDNQLISHLSNLNIVNGTIEFMGSLSHKELCILYKNLDVFVFPSKRESLGLVGLEAMASGIPVIGSRIGGIMTYLEDKINGFLFSPSDPGDLSECLFKYYSLPLNIKRSYIEAAKTTASKYKTENVCKSLYKKIFPKYEK